MSFKFLGKKPPKGRFWARAGWDEMVREVECSKLEAEHFRGALKEAADLLKAQAVSPYGGSYNAEALKRISKQLRVSAGETE